MNFLDRIKPYKNLPFHGVIMPEIHLPSDVKKEIGVKNDCSSIEFLT